MARPTSLVIRYTGSNDDDIERQFELDRQRRAHRGYVPTRTEWVLAGGVFSFAHMGWLAELFGFHPSLRVTYTLEDAGPDKKGPASPD